MGERFPILFSGPQRRLALLGIRPSRSYVEVDSETLRVRFGWAFQADIPRSLVELVEHSSLRTRRRGVNGTRGRLVVNGSGKGLVRVALREEIRVSNIRPTKLRELTVSLEDPDGFLAALGADAPPRVPGEPASAPTD